MFSRHACRTIGKKNAHMVRIAVSELMRAHFCGTSRWCMRVMMLILQACGDDDDDDDLSTTCHCVRLFKLSLF